MWFDMRYRIQQIAEAQAVAAKERAEFIRRVMIIESWKEREGFTQTDAKALAREIAREIRNNSP